MEGLVSLQSGAVWVVGVFLLLCTIILILLRDRHRFG
jgi:hypothetical protein